MKILKLTLCALFLISGFVSSANSENQGRSEDIALFHRKALALAKSNMDSALYYVSKARSLLTKGEVSWGLATNMSVEGRILMVNRQDADAFFKYLQALDTYKGLDTLDYFNQYATTRNLASISKRNGQLESAIDFYNQAYGLAKLTMEVYPDESVSFNLPKALNNMLYFKAQCLEQSGRLEESAEILIELIEKAENQNNTSLKSDALIQVGLIYKDIGNYGEAESYFERVLGLADVSDYRWSKAMHNLAYTDFLNGSYNLAKERFKQAIQRLQIQPDLKTKKSLRSMLFISHLDLGEVYFVQGKYEKAIDKWQAALRVYDQLEGEPSLYIIYDWLLRAYLETGSELAKEARDKYMAYNTRYLADGQALAEGLKGNLFANQIARFEESKIQQARLEAAKRRNVENLVILLAAFSVLLPAVLLIYKKRKGKSLFKGFLDILSE